MNLRVHFWGTRGSVPSGGGVDVLREKLVRALRLADGRRFASDAEAVAFVREAVPFSVGGAYGVNTSCVSVAAPGAAPLLLDAGTGLREAGIARVAAGHKEQHLLLSHLHWDHIQGFPFYAPLFDPEFHLVVHSCHPQAEAVLRAQMASPVFPVPFEKLAAKITVQVHARQSTFDAGGFSVFASKQCHPDDSFGYRVERAGKVVVYSTDAGWPDFDPCADCKCPVLFSNADLLIYDAMLSEEEAVVAKASWGHSSNLAAVRLGVLGGVKALALTHHDPARSDAAVERSLQEALAFAAAEKRAQAAPPEVLEKIFAAYDGLEVTV